MAARDIQIRITANVSEYEEAMDGVHGRTYFMLIWPTRCPPEATH